MKTIAIYGGSFNPPHIAHQMTCLWVVETCDVDAVWMVPTYRHPFDKELVAFEHRKAMCELAAAPLGERVQVSEIERDLALESSRTVETLRALRRWHPDVGLRLVIGADILAETGKWYRWEEIEQLAPPIVIGRVGYEAEGVEIALPNVSSTEVRARLARGQSALPLVSRSVMDYIARQGLYR